MNALSENREGLVELCRRYRVQRLVLFGSGSRDDFDPQRSDLDFLVEFVPLPPEHKANTYFGLLFALEDLFQRPVDLVEAGAIRNPYVRRSIEQRQRLLYAAA